MPTKCPKCTVDAVVLVTPYHGAIAKIAINKLKLKVKDERRLILSLKTPVREHAAGTVLPKETNLSEFLANDCVISVGVQSVEHKQPKTPDAMPATDVTARTVRDMSDTEPREFIPIEVTLAGTRVCVYRRNVEEADWQDENFFDADYSVAAATGSLMWDGSWACIELLRNPSSWFTQILHSKRVVELGAGVGLLGLCLAAAAGSHVLLTDVPAIVDGTLTPNIAANASSSSSAESSASGNSSWLGSSRFGEQGGTAVAQGLDWERPVDAQREFNGDNDPLDAEVVLAAECVWLAELVEPFVRTVLALMRGPRHPPCVLAFRDRSKAESTTFSSADSVVARFVAAGCDVQEHEQCDAPEARGLYTRFFVVRLAPRAPM